MKTPVPESASAFSKKTPYEMFDRALKTTNSINEWHLSQVKSHNVMQTSNVKY